MESTKWTLKSLEQFKKTHKPPLQHLPFFFCCDRWYTFLFGPEKYCVKKQFCVTFIYAIWKQAPVDLIRRFILKKHYSQHLLVHRAGKKRINWNDYLWRISVQKTLYSLFHPPTPNLANSKPLRFFSAKQQC